MKGATQGTVIGVPWLETLNLTCPVVREVAFPKESGQAVPRNDRFGWAFF